MPEADYLAIARSNDNFKMWVLKWLHNTSLDVSAIGSGVPVPGTEQALTPVAPVTKAFGAITNAYVALALIPALGQLSNLFLKNTTDSDIAVSLDGAAQWETVHAGEERTFDFGANNRVLRDDPRIKYLGSAPTLGELYASGYN